MNRPQIAVIRTVIVCVLALCAAARADWPQFLGPNRDATSPETGLLRAWPESGPKELWSTPVGPGYGAAAIVGDEVYVLDRIEDKTDILRCISFADGKDLWTYSYDAPGSVGHTGSRNPPTVDDKYVYSVGMMGNFLCVDRKTHQPVWQKDLLKDFKMELPQWGFAQGPILYKNLVIIAVQSPETFAVAFDRETGNIAWKSPAMGLPGYVSPLITTLAGVEQLVVVAASKRDGSVEGGTAGLSLADGSQLWKYEGWQCFIPIPNPTPLPGDKLFITAGYDSGSATIQIKKTDKGLEAVEVYKLDPKVCGGHIQQPIVYKDHIYVCSNSNERQDGLCCFTLDGTRLWNTKATEGLPLLERGSMILADNMLIALDGKSGELYLIDPSPEGYKQLAKAKVVDGRELWGPLALSGGKLIVRSQDVMKCLDLKRP
jgi:outer membrane protein assembly factor BamB